MKPNSFDKKISKVLKEIRKNKGISQHCISQFNGVSESNFGKYDHGDIAYTMGFLKEVCDILDVSLLQICLISEGMAIKDVLSKPLAIILVKFISTLPENEVRSQEVINELISLLEPKQGLLHKKLHSLDENFNKALTG